jgi:hypothetical protein
MGKGGGLGDPDITRKLRAVRALEIIGSDKARDVLKALSEQAPAARVKDAAAESLKFLKTGQRPPPPRPEGAAPVPPQAPEEEVIIQEGGQIIIDDS